MPERRGYDTLSAPLAYHIETSATDDCALALTDIEEQKHYEEWQSMIDQYLIEWGRDPSIVEDEEVRPPTPISLQTACRLAIAFRDGGMAPPLRIIPNGEGGIVFERRGADFFERFEVHHDGAIEYALFHECRLIHRSQL